RPTTCRPSSGWPANRRASALLPAAFRVRGFRFQGPADLLTSPALEMRTVILGLYVIVQTGSVLLPTAFGSLLLLGTLASPMFGVLGDRLRGRAGGAPRGRVLHRPGG